MEIRWYVLQLLDSNMIRVSTKVPIVHVYQSTSGCALLRVKKPAQHLDWMRPCMHFSGRSYMPTMIPATSVRLQAGNTIQSTAYTANPLTYQSTSQMGMAPAGSENVSVMMAPVSQQMNKLSEVCAPKPGWAHESELAAFLSTAFTDPVVKLKPTIANMMVRFTNGILMRMTCFFCCPPCALVNLCNPHGEVGVSAEQKADNKMRQRAAAVTEMLADASLGKEMVSAGLELFFVQLFETYRERSHVGDVVVKAYMLIPGEPAGGAALMALAINNEINEFMQSIFITYYQRGYLDLCSICSSIVAYEGCFTWYFGHVSRQHQSYVGSVKEGVTLKFFYPDNRVHFNFRFIKHHLRTEAFRNALAVMLKQVTLRAAKFNLQEFSKVSHKRDYHQSQMRPFLKSWLQHQFNVPA